MTHRQNHIIDDLQTLITAAVNREISINNTDESLNFETIFTQPINISRYAFARNTDEPPPTTDVSNVSVPDGSNASIPTPVPEPAPVATPELRTNTFPNIRDVNRQINNQRNNRNINRNLETVINNYSNSFRVYQSQITEYQNVMRMYVENNIYGRNTQNQPYSSNTANRPPPPPPLQRDYMNTNRRSSPTYAETANTATGVGEDDPFGSGLFQLYPDSIIELLRSISGIITFDISNVAHEPENNQPLSPESVENILSENSSVFNFNIEHYPDNDMCPISLEPFIENEDVVKLNGCNHMFKKPLISNWISRNNLFCPVCRRVLTNPA
jgi:hypothetical protein